MNFLLSTFLYKVYFRFKCTHIRIYIYIKSRFDFSDFFPYQYMQCYWNDFFFLITSTSWFSLKLLFKTKSLKTYLGKAQFVFIVVYYNWTWICYVMHQKLINEKQNHFSEYMRKFSNFFFLILIIGWKALETFSFFSGIDCNIN